MIRKENGPLHNSFDLLATNWDADGKEYIAFVEHKKFPIYGSQFHTEKSGIVAPVYVEIPISQNAISFRKYLADFFVGEALKNENKFEDQKHLNENNFNNFNPVYFLSFGNPTLGYGYFFSVNGYPVRNIFLD